MLNFGARVIGIIPKHPPMHWAPEHEYNMHRIAYDCVCPCQPTYLIRDKEYIEVNHRQLTPLLPQNYSPTGV